MRRCAIPGSAMSPATRRTCFPVGSISLAAAVSACWRRPLMTTFAPLFTSSIAVAFPRPLLPPVITKTFPCTLTLRFLLGFLQSVRPANELGGPLADDHARRHGVARGDAGHDRR